MNRICLLIICSVWLTGNSVHAQVSETDPLFVVLQGKDQALFKQGFNQCDLAITASLVAEDLEFYHDKGGIDKGKQSFLDTMNSGLCKSGKNAIHRHLVTGSLAVFPMTDQGKLYGAIQMGEHQFSAPGEQPTAQPAKFIHLWLLDNGEWRLSRVLSYDHH